MTQDELLQLIEEAAKDGRKSLDLRRRKLTTLPPEIGQLSSLQTLGISDNRLTALPHLITTFPD